MENGKSLLQYPEGLYYDTYMVKNSNRFPVCHFKHLLGILDCTAQVGECWPSSLDLWQSLFLFQATLKSNRFLGRLVNELE